MQKNIKNIGKIHSNTSDSDRAELRAADTHIPSETAIDELLRWAADESNAEIDFAAIRLRAVENSSRSSFRRVRRIRSIVAASAAVLLLFCVFALAISKINDCGKEPQVSAGITAGIDSTPEPFSDPASLPSDYDSYQTAGTAADTAIESTSLFPQNLPSGMQKKVDNGTLRTSAEGIDAEGNRLYYDCEVVDGAPYQLSVGQVGSFSDGVDFVYYWQITSDTCLRVRFFGFNQKAAEQLFSELSGQITGLGGKTASAGNTPAPRVPARIPTDTPAPSNDGTAPVAGLPADNNAPVEAVPVYAAPIGTAPVIDIPFDPVDPAGYEDVGGEISLAASDLSEIGIGGTSSSRDEDDVPDCSNAERVDSPAPESSTIDSGRINSENDKVSSGKSENNSAAADPAAGRSNDKAHTGKTSDGFSTARP